VVNLKVIPVHFHLVGDYRANLKHVKITLAQIERKMDPDLEDTLMEVAYVMKEMARTIVPVDTGSLQKSIRVEHVKELAVRVRAGGYVVNPKSRKLVNYAKFVEEGTTKMKAQPYLKPAWEHVKEFASARVEETLRRIAFESM